MNDRGKSSSVYNDLRLKGDFCDAVIKVGDVEFQVHKVILCKCSPYFWALFKRWSTPDRKTFEIPGLSPDMMQLIIEFAYTGHVSITGNNVQELLMAADQFNVMDVVHACCDFLAGHLSPQNCIGIWQFTKICLLADLQRKAYSYITQHFEEVVSCEEFQRLSAQDLAGVLARDDLNVRKESTAFEAVLHWIAHAPEKRKVHIAELLSKVRLAYTGIDYIQMNVLSNDLVESNPGCLDIVQNALHISCMMINHHMCVIHDPLARPRLPNTILLAIGGWSGGDPTNGIEAYNVNTGRWFDVTNESERPRAYHGAVFLNGSVYCVGGFDRLEHFNSVRRLDLDTHTWHEAAPMHHRRCYVSVTVLNGCIYAMGGYDGHLRLSSAECYTPETNQWILIRAMHEQRSDASCTTLNNMIYICGGFNGNECLQTCEYYRPETNQWTMITPMSSRRSGIGVIAYADHVYAVGGFDGNNRLRTAEAYNPQTNTWHTVASMKTTRSNFGIEAINDLLFAVGGFNGFSTSSNVEYYDSMTNEWCDAADMEIFRSALSCCVVSRLPNMPRFSNALLHSNETEDEMDDSEESA